MAPSQRVTFETVKSVLYSAVTNSFTAFGTPTAHAWRTIRVVNTSDGDMAISFDGTNSNIVVPAGSFVLYDFTANKENTAFGFFLAKNTQIYIKYLTAPTKLSVYVEGVYGDGE